MHEVKLRVVTLTWKPFKFMEDRILRHKRSNSDPVQRKLEKHKVNNIYEASHHLKLNKMGKLEDCDKLKKRKSSNKEVQDLLKQEIQELQDQLQDQFKARQALQKALSKRPLSHDVMTDKSIPKPAKALIKEIAVLELEVVNLEQYLLSLYRKTFDQQVSSLSTMEGVCRSNSTQSGIHPVVPGNDIKSTQDNSVNHSNHVNWSQTSIGNPPNESNATWGAAKLLDSSINRCYSSISHHSPRTSPTTKAIARAVDSYHSIPLSMLEQAQNDALTSVSLADHLGRHIYDDVLETPNWISEEMINRISAIYCELADPPLINFDYPGSPISFSSSLNESTMQGQSDRWSPQYENFSSFNSYADNPFRIGESKEFHGPYSTMAEVQWICRDSQKLSDIQQKLQDYRSLVSRLEVIDPRKMKHEEKLAFWINVHNGLVMHAFLVYGIPTNNVKRVSLALKAAYNVGGQTVNIDMIQSSILGCRLLRPGQWLRLLFSSKTKFKVGDARKGYSIDHPEPRLYFALCSGSHSDPAVRVYSPKRVFDDLEAAKEEYIQSTFIVHKEKKLLLPKIVDYFARDLDLCPAGLVEMIEHLLPDSLRKSIQQCQHKKFGKSVEWIPHNFTFRYLLSKELVQ